MLKTSEKNIQINSASDSWIHVHTSPHKKYTYTLLGGGGGGEIIS